MAMNLDARQRAMLKAMGITVWLPEPQQPEQPAEIAAEAIAEVTARAAVALPAQASHAAPPPTPAHSPAVQEAAPPTPPVAPQPPPAPAPRPAPAPTIASAPATPSTQPFVQQPAAGPAGQPGLGWTVGPAQLVYPHAPQHAQAASQGGWLILLEPPANPLLSSAAAQKPAADSARTALQGDTARLLDNMLRALNLQQQPRVFSAALHRAPPDADLSRAQPLQPTLHALLRDLRPDCVLVLGLASARAVLGRHEALGRLRAEPHRVADVPTIVTYDLNYLLRAPQAKAGAWADLVLAQSFTKPV